MNEERNLREEINELGIVSMEDIGFGSRESAFAALDAIREHNKMFPEKKLEEMMEHARQDAYNTMAGTRGGKSEN